MIRVMPGGLCHAHGPFKAPLMYCPHWPLCAEIPANPFFVEAGDWFVKYDDVLQVAKEKVVQEAIFLIDTMSFDRKALSAAIEDLREIHVKNDKYRRLANWNA